MLDTKAEEKILIVCAGPSGLPPVRAAVARTLAELDAR